VWERSFVAVSVLTGASVEDALAQLLPGAEMRAADLVAKLREPRRSVRAAALAQVAQEVVFAIEETALR